MKKTLLLNLMYVALFGLGYLGLFSLSSFFHRLLEYDINTLEEWLYHNRLVIIVLAKLFALFSILILPEMHSFTKAEFIRLKSVYSSVFRRQWIVGDKVWLLYLVFCLTLYGLFYNLKMGASSDVGDNFIYQVFMCTAFWFCDLIFLRNIYKNLLPLSSKYSRWILALLKSSLIFTCTAFVSYLPISDLVQFYLVFTCILYLLENEYTLFSGWVTFFVWATICSLIQPFNFIINVDNVKFIMTAESFSLPWCFIFLVVFSIYVLSPPYIERLYKFLFLPPKKS